MLHGKGTVVEIAGLAGSTPAIDRHEGFMSVISACPDIRLLAKEDGAWLRSRAEERMDTLLARFPEIDVSMLKTTVWLPVPMQPPCAGKGRRACALSAQTPFPAKAMGGASAFGRIGCDIYLSHRRRPCDADCDGYSE